MARWDEFHAAHFDDAAKRAWFATHMAVHQAATTATTSDGVAVAQPPHATREEREDAWTMPAPGEDEAAWQARHGVRYLTPGAVRIFDASRRFREQRGSWDGADSGARTEPADAAATCRPPAPSDLEALRRRALEARRTKRHTEGML